jgi:hypothetical protein
MIRHLVAFLPGEHALFVVYRHWFKVFIVGKIDLLLFFALAVGVYIVENSVVTTDPAVAEAIALFTVSLGGLVLWMHFFGVWTDHWLDVWVVTNLRIIDVEQIGLLKREVASFPLDKIEDVTWRSHGIIQNILKFGDVQMQTASSTTHLNMIQVPHPAEVKDEVVKAMEAHRGAFPR